MEDSGTNRAKRHLDIQSEVGLDLLDKMKSKEQTDNVFPCALGIGTRRTLVS